MECASASYSGVLDIFMLTLFVEQMAVCSGDFSRKTDQVVNFGTKSCETFLENLESGSRALSEAVFPVCIDFSSQCILDTCAEESYEVSTQMLKAPVRDASCQTSSYPSSVWAFLQHDGDIPISTLETLPAQIATAVSCPCCGASQKEVNCCHLHLGGFQRSTCGTSACRTELPALALHSSASSLLSNSAKTSSLADSSTTEYRKLPHSHSDSALCRMIQCRDDSPQVSWLGAPSTSGTWQQYTSCARPRDGDRREKSRASSMPSACSCQRVHSDGFSPSVITNDNGLVIDPGSSSNKNSETPINCEDYDSNCKLPYEVGTGQRHGRRPPSGLHLSRCLAKENNSCLRVGLNANTVDIDTRTSETQFLDPHSLNCQRIVPQVFTSLYLLVMFVYGLCNTPIERWNLL
jgi:hypothetical protein